MKEKNENFNFADFLLNHYQGKNEILYLFRDNEYSRNRLKQEVHSLSVDLMNAGIQKDDRVLLLLHDSPACVVSLLSIMAVGAIPVPISPKTRVETLKYILLDSESKLCIVEADIYKDVLSVTKDLGMNEDALFVQDAYLEKPFSCLSHGLSSSFAKEEKPFSFVKKSPEETTFWQYTSGTTGDPKAVKHNAKGMIQNTKLFAEKTLSIGDQDVIYSVAKMFFGYGLGNSFFFPLLTGAKALLDDRWPKPSLLIDNISKNKVTVFFAVPAIYNVLLQGNIENDLVQKLRICFSAGAQLPADLYQKWLDKFSVGILDGIGATELGHVFLTNTPDVQKMAATGKVVNGYEVELRNEEGDLVGLNEKAVLWVKGPSVSLGYWNKEKVTSERFQNGWYKTGDLFSKDEDGFYYCHGREDDLFKVNGRFVVPVEIEKYVMLNFNDVTEAVLVGIEDECGLTYAHLFITIHSEEKTNIEEVIEMDLKSRFENYKAPRGVHQVSEFPRNTNGKLQRKSLIENFKNSVSEVN